jgi:t-SNARE complex subunit (syntaxin)
MQEKTKAKYRERVERQFKIVKPDATAAELKVAASINRNTSCNRSVQDVVDGDFQDIFAKHLMTNQHKAAQQAIADINDKHQVRARRPPFVRPRRANVFVRIL